MNTKSTYSELHDSSSSGSDSGFPEAKEAEEGNGGTNTHGTPNHRHEAIAHGGVTSPLTITNKHENVPFTTKIINHRYFIAMSKVAVPTLTGG
jgi:hypothetical protein